jgi:hypothetical protein
MKNGYTPKQFAVDLTLGWISAMAKERTNDLDKLTESEKKLVKKQLANLHNRLLDKEKGLSGTYLEVE